MSQRGFHFHFLSSKQFIIPGIETPTRVWTSIIGKFDLCLFRTLCRHRGFMGSTIQLKGYAVKTPLRHFRACLWASIFWRKSISWLSHYERQKDFRSNPCLYLQAVLQHLVLLFQKLLATHVIVKIHRYRSLARSLQ